MDIYQISVDLKPGVRDTAVSRSASTAYLGALKADGRIEGWRLLRRKLGLGMPGLGEFQILIETRDLAQLDTAFTTVSTRNEPIEGAHHGVSSPGPRISRPPSTATFPTRTATGEETF